MAPTPTETTTEAPRAMASDGVGDGLKITTQKQKPLVAFALVTDVQYADVEDGWDFHHTSRRYYRNALPQLEAAVSEWLRVAKSEEEEHGDRLRFAVDLGDLIDGKNKPAGTSRQSLERVKRAWEPFEREVGVVHHLVGNHELYNMSVGDFKHELLWPAAGRSYYAFTVPEAPRYRFVVLDCYGLSILGREKQDPARQEAMALLRRINPNENLNSPTGLSEEERRFVAFNGGVDREQLEWLRGELERADAADEHVLLFTHIPVHPATAPPSALLWNYPQVLELVQRSTSVRAVFSGHSHDDAYVFTSGELGVRSRGVHFVVSDAILECAPTETAHAIVRLYEDRVVVHGYGKIPSRELLFLGAKQ